MKMVELLSLKDYQFTFKAFFYVDVSIHFNPIVLRKAKIVYNFGLSECNMVNTHSAKLKTAELAVLIKKKKKRGWWGWGGSRG